MRVIEIAHVEGAVFPILTCDGEPFARSNSVTVHLEYMKPTQVFINGSRVTEPTRLVKNGHVVAQDNAGREGKGEWLANGPLHKMLVDAIPSSEDAAPFEVPDLRESIERARDAAQTAVYEPHVRVHHPQCRAVRERDEALCEGYGCG